MHREKATEKDLDKEAALCAVHKISLFKQLDKTVLLHFLVLSA